MSFRFLHCADLHFGRHATLGGERYGDYFRAFTAVADHAIAERVDCILIAGDMFDEQEPSAETLRRAAAALRPLRTEAIPVIAIEGNHDRRKRTEPACALDVLADEGYLTLLRPGTTGDGTLIPAVVESYTGVRIAGLGFPGHQAAERLRSAVGMLPGDDRFTIMLVHALVTLGDPDMTYGACSYDEIADLGGRISYLALGHRHTRAGLDARLGGWIYNPGALEFVHPFDYRQPADLRGYFDVTVRDDRTFSVAHIAVRKRPALVAAVGISGCETPIQVCDAAVTAAASAMGIERGEETDIPAAMDAPLAADIPAAMDASLAADIPAAMDASLAKDIPDTMDDRSAGEAPAGLKPIVIVRLTGMPAIPRSRIPRAEIVRRIIGELGAVHADVLDADLEYTSDAGHIAADGFALEHLLDRARAATADLIAGAMLAPGRADALAAALIEVKESLRDAGDSPAPELLDRCAAALEPFVPDGDA